MEENRKVRPANCASKRAKTRHAPEKEDVEFSGPAAGNLRGSEQFLGILRKLGQLTIAKVTSNEETELHRVWMRYVITNGQHERQIDKTFLRQRRQKSSRIERRTPGSGRVL